MRSWRGPGLGTKGLFLQLFSPVEQCAAVLNFYLKVSFLKWNMVETSKWERALLALQTRRERAWFMTKPLCASSWEKCSLPGHTLLAQSLVSAPRASTLREPGEGCIPALQDFVRMQPEQGTTTWVPCQYANPGQGGNNFQSLSLRPERDRYPEQPGEGGASLKAPGACP